MKETVLSVLEGALEEKATIKLKSLRKQVFMSLQLDEDEKSSKKEYKKAIQALEKEEKLVLDADGLISLKGKNSKKKSQKRKRKEDADDETPSKKKNSQMTEDEDVVDDKEKSENEGGDEIPKSKKPCKGNPQGVTRLFVGNLPFAVDEASLKTFLPGITHIKWITDKETGKFYGSSFVEMDSSENSADAVAKAGSQLMGRPIKVNFAPARPGDVWPPPNNKNATSGEGGQAGGSGVKAMSAKPENCKKLFIGNLSYEIDGRVSKVIGSNSVHSVLVTHLDHSLLSKFTR